MERKCELESFQVLKAECSLDLTPLEGGVSEGVPLEETVRLSYRRPKDADLPKVLLEMDSTLSDKGASRVKFHFRSRAVYAFSEMPEDIEEVLTNECYPELRERVYRVINDFLVSSGNKPVSME